VLAYAIEPGELVVRTVTGLRRVPLAGAAGARIVEGRLLWRLFGTGFPGYHVGTYWLMGVGRVQAYCSRASGPFVLIERAGARPLVLTPADTDAFLRALPPDAPAR